MSSLELQVISSPAELRTNAPVWDALWKRSEVTLPGAQAEPLAIWLEEFAPRKPFRALVLRDGPRMVASLPLVEQRMAGVLRVGCLPNNYYAMGGDLAIDPDCDRQQVFEQLAAALKRLPWRMLMIQDIAIDAPRWRHFHQATTDAGMAAEIEHRWDTGITDIPHDWKLFMASRSRKVRSAMKRSFERLRDAGGSELRVLETVASHEIEQHLRRGFEVEDRSWKSGAGTSVLRLPRVFRFYCRQAAALAASGNLELAFLEHAGQPIGFMYGIHAKGVYYPAKIGYDDQFAAFSPGQLLNCQMLERFQENAKLEHLDFHGPIGPAFGRWATRSYRSGQLLVAVRGQLGRAICRAIPKLRSRIRTLRNRWRGSAPTAIETYPLRATGKQNTESSSDCLASGEVTLV